MKIGYIHNTYLDKRSYLYIVNKDIQFVRVPDLCKLGSYLGFKMFKNIWSFLQNSYSGISPYTYDVLHLFNGISLSSKPWVSSFEDRVPRLGRVPKCFEDFAVKRLAHSSCKKLIAISENAAVIQRSYLEREYPLLADKILEKLIVIPPQQKLFRRKVVDRVAPSNKIVFTFVGRQFFRKGGLEVLKVFEKICLEYSHCELNLVSILETDQYATSTNSDDVEKVKYIIKNTPNNIIHHNSLNNEEVIKLLNSSHVALLPTHDDSYGFSVLEAQACGTPVITTDIKALNEINNNECGWIIGVPKDECMKAFISSSNGRQELREYIQKGLFNHVLDIIKHPEQIELKSKKSLDRVNEFHNPDNLGKKIYNVYKEIFDAENY